MSGATWFQVTYAALSFRVMEKARESESRKLEYLSLRELPLMAGRVLSLSGFLLAWSHFGETGLRTTIFILGICQMSVFLFFPKFSEPEPVNASFEES
jgi:hypothetical protein